MPAVRWEVRRFSTLPSTNAYLLAAARAGAREGLVAVADHQTAGRGRLGRTWASPPGRNLLASVLLRPVLDPGELFCCTGVVGLAPAEACGAVAGVEPQVKWPNDLVVDDRKLAGVLAEADAAAPGGAPGSVAVVVGIGCNVAWSPGGEAATSLEALAGREVGRDDLLDALLGCLAPWADALGSAAGRRAVVAELVRRSATLGRSVRIETARAGEGGRVVEGTALELTAQGHLVVGTPGGPVAVAVGDVVHLRPGGPGAVK